MSRGVVFRSLILDDHSWFRAGVEHCIAQFKKFQIFGGRYRGQLVKDGGRLRNVLTIITGLVILQTRWSPLRSHRPLLDEEELAAVEEVAADIAPAREVIDGKAIGAHTDIDLVDGKICGRGPEPSNEHINTGRSARDFSKGVLALNVFVWFALRRTHCTCRRSRAGLVVGTLVALRCPVQCCSVEHSDCSLGVEQRRDQRLSGAFGVQAR